MRVLPVAILSLFYAAALSADEVEVQFFVAPDCPIVNSYAPEIERLFHEYQGRGVGFLLVYPDRDLEESTVKKHLADYSLTLPFEIDHKHTRVEAVNATTTPEVVVFDAKGAVRYRGKIDDRYSELGDRKATVSATYLRDAIEALLAGHAPPVTATEPIGCLIEK